MSADPDGDLVMAAVNDGRITADSIPRWLMAMRADSAGTRSTLASLSPVNIYAPNFTGHTGDLAAAERGAHGVRNALTQRGFHTPAKKVAASKPAPSYDLPSAPPSTTYDNAGMPVPALPTPVRVVWGKDPATWSAEEHMDNFRRMLWAGSATVSASLPPAPGGAGYFQPSPNATHLPVPTPDGGFEMQPNPNYMPRSGS